MARAKIDNLQAVRFLIIREYRKTVAGPDLILGCLRRLSRLGLDFRPVSTVKFAAQCAFSNLPRHPLPGQPHLHAVLQITARFFQAPY